MRSSLALLLVATVAPVAGQDAPSLREQHLERIERLEREHLESFKLFNACRPMVLVIEELGDYAIAIDLTEETLRNVTESRLRAARIYTEDLEKSKYAILYVNINMADSAYGIDVEYYKQVTDEFGKTRSAITWSSGSIGVASGANFILSSLSRHLDRFLTTYLRVNEEACGGPP